jgi:hypothetical protein
MAWTPTRATISRSSRQPNAAKKKPRRIAPAGLFLTLDRFSSALTAVHGVFGAACCRVHVGGRTAHGVTPGDHKRGTRQRDGNQFTDHDRSLV